MASSLRYGCVYRCVYGMAHRDTLETWVRTHVFDARTALRLRMWRSRHLLRIAATQSCGTLITPRLVYRLERAHRLACIGANMRLRKLQRCVLIHLWRPTGRLHMSHWNRFLSERG